MEADYGLSHSLSSPFSLHTSSLLSYKIDGYQILFAEIGPNLIDLSLITVRLVYPFCMEEGLTFVRTT